MIQQQTVSLVEAQAVVPAGLAHADEIGQSRWGIARQYRDRAGQGLHGACI